MRYELTPEDERRARMVLRTQIVLAAIGLPLLVLWLAQS
jgi:hypothetical protein